MIVSDKSGYDIRTDRHDGSIRISLYAIWLRNLKNDYP